MLIVTSLHALYSYVVQKLSRVACVHVHAGPRYLCLSSRRLSAGPHGCWVVNPRCHFQVTRNFRLCDFFFARSIIRAIFFRTIKHDSNFRESYAFTRNQHIFLEYVRGCTRRSSLLHVTA